MAALFLFRNKSVHVGRPILIVPSGLSFGSAILFFVKVNQVLVRLWARTQSPVFSCRLSEISDRRYREPGTGRCSIDV